VTHNAASGEVIIADIGPVDGHKNPQAQKQWPLAVIYPSTHSWMTRDHNEICTAVIFEE